MDKPQFNRIKVLLVEKGKSSKELAKELKKTNTTISRWCTNDVQPQIETLYEIAKFLDVDVRDLLIPTKK